MAGPGAIPADFGGGARVFLADPAQAGTAEAVRDLGAANLQVLHLLAPLFPDGAEPERVRVAALIRNALAAAEHANARENATRELQPMTRIPAAWGAVDNLAAVRLNQVPQFAGDTKDPRTVVRWLTRIFATSIAHNLNQDATLSLLIQASTQGASDFIDGMREKGLDIPPIVRALELRYGQLCAADDALNKVNTLERSPDEDLSTFLDRLRYMAKMAKRHIDNDANRSAAIDLLVEANIRRVLPESVKIALDERILARSRSGAPPFTTADLEKECIDLENRRAERKEKVVAQARSNQGRFRRVQAVLQQQPQWAGQACYVNSGMPEAYQTYYTESYEDPVEGEYYDESQEDPEAEMSMVALINEINYVDRRYQEKGLVADQDRVFQKATNRYNRYPQNQGQGRGQPPPRAYPPRNPTYGNPRPRYQGPPQAARQVYAAPQARPQAPIRGPQAQFGTPAHQGAPAQYGTPQQYGAPQYYGAPAYHGAPVQQGAPQYQGAPAYPGAPAPAAGPPNRLPEGQRPTIRDLLARANCVNGDCVKCGIHGHLMSSDACALRGKPLVDRPCVRCKKGLHAADDCVATIQQQPQAVVNQIYDDVWTDEEDLNFQ